jgi:NDP-sugar pyrophosphorylase family protein
LIDEAIVLAGGVGSRLFPLTKHRPKPLVPIANYTMLDWNFHVLATNGVKRVIVVVRYLGDMIINHIEQYTSNVHKDMEIIVPRDIDSLDTADAVRKVSHLIKSDNFIVTMADIVTNIDLKALSSFHLEKGGIASISLKSIYNQPHQFGVILLNANNEILHFLEKPKPQELYLTTLVFQKRESVFYHTNLINSGIYVFKREILEILKDFNLMDFGKDVFPFILKKKLGIFGFTSETDYFWADCGRPKQLLWTNQDVIANWNWQILPKGVERNGSWYGQEILLDESVEIQPPCAIDDNVVIKKGTKIINSSIGFGTIIGENSVIENSIVWEDVKIHDNVVIKNTIIADKAEIGSNCIIKEDCIIAKGQSISPNTKLPKGTVIDGEKS